MAERPGEADATRRAPSGTTRNPERTRAAILEAACVEVAENGYAGARIDEIARRAGANKRMIYHYFGDKDGLYLAVLEETYRRIRTAEHALDLAHREPQDALAELSLFTWQYFLDHPEFLSILATENILQARFLRRSEAVSEMHSHFLSELADVLRRGGEAGVFRPDLDALTVYLTIASLGYFYQSNRHTLSAIFSRDLQTGDEIARWGEHIVATVLASVRPANFSRRGVDSRGEGGADITK